MARTHRQTRKLLRLPSRAALCTLALVYAGALAASAPPIHVRNFREVNAGIYRGGEPSVVGLEELGAMGIKLVVDLRESSDATKFEQRHVEQLGMKYINIPFSGWAAPSRAQVDKVLALLLHADPAHPVFVHCHRGKDRTGTVVACYRIQHDGWNNHQALAEANKYGMSYAERGMRSFVMQFPHAPVQAMASPAVPVTPAPAAARP